MSFWQDVMSVFCNIQEQEMLTSKDRFWKYKNQWVKKNLSKIKQRGHRGNKTRSQSKQQVSEPVSTILGQNCIFPHTYTAFFLSSWDDLICQPDGISEDYLQWCNIVHRTVTHTHSWTCHFLKRNNIIAWS